jgi:hypothetical protein
MRHGTLTSRIIRLGGSKQVIVKYVRISVKMTLFGSIRLMQNIYLHGFDGNIYSDGTWSIDSGIDGQERESTWDI